MSLIISFGMSCVMTFFVTAVNTGFVENFLLLWMKAWATAFPVAFPTALIIVPLGRKLTIRLTNDPTELPSSD
jgi:hypothetical protein